MARALGWLLVPALVGAGIGAASCLPGDTRPVPGSLYVTTTGSSPLLGADHSTTTVDGWTISFDRFLLSLAGTSFGEDPACASYYEADYRRLLDMKIPGPQKVGLMYGLGHCDFGFQVAGPNLTTLLGKGVSSADLAMMGVAATDPYATNTGITVYAKGSATKGSITKTFAWSFRKRNRYEKCASGGGGGVPNATNPANVTDAATPLDAAKALDAAFAADAAKAVDASANTVGAAMGSETDAQGVDLKGGIASTLDLAVHGETLFLDSNGALRFDILAEADDKHGGNADGDIALSELAQVLLNDVGLGGRYFQSVSDLARGPGTPVWVNLEDYVYLGLVPKVVRYDGDGSCIVNKPRD